MSALLASVMALGSAVVLLAPAAAATAPGPVERLTTFPTQGGLGVAWEAGWPAAEEYRVERRPAGEAEWAEVATVSHASESWLTWIDSGTAPGASAEYRVTGLSSGVAGQSVETSGTRATSVPEPGSQSLLAMDSDKRDPVVFRSSDPGTTIATEPGRTVINATKDTLPVRDATFGSTVLPGPGTYRRGGAFGAGLTTSDTYNDSYGCTSDDWILEVRSVAYDADATPLVLDASYVKTCDGDRVERVEIRFGVASGYALPEADPTRVGRLTTYDGVGITETVTLTNAGPEPLRVGRPRVTRSPDAPLESTDRDWAATGGTCDGATLGEGETCEVEVTFSTHWEGRRLALLELPARDDTGPVAPYLVKLDGYGGSEPDGPYFVNSDRLLGAVRTTWAAPRHDGGYPVTSYEVARLSSRDGYTVPTTVAVVDGSARSYVDSDVEHGEVYTYRVEARNEVGRSPWVYSRHSVEPGTRGILVSGRRADDEPRLLVEEHRGGDDLGPRVLGTDEAHDHLAPAASPGGTRIAYSRSTSPGLGEDGEYDLWTGTITEPASARVTSMPGAEVDAAFSPDASEIAFTHVAAGGARSVWVVPAHGGTPRLLRDGAASPVWTADGSTILVEDDSFAGAPLLRLSREDGTAEPVAGTEGATDPALARSGALAYIDAAGDLVERNPETSAGEVVYSASAAASQLSDPAFDVDGRLMVTRVTDYGDREVILLGLGGGRLAEWCRGAGGCAEPAPVQLDVTDPVITVDGVDDHVRGAVAVSVGATDGTETPEVALHPECRLDASTWQDCAGEVTFDGLSDGDHVLRVRVTDEAGHRATHFEAFVSDLNRPSVRLLRPRGLSQLGRRVRSRWEGSDQTSPVDRYEVRIRRGSATSGFSRYRRISGWPAWTSRSEASLPLAPGGELCVRVRAEDAAGNRSTFRRRCIARPLDDSALSTSRGWRRVETRRGWQRSLTVTSTRGARLRYPGVTTRRIGVLASTCGSCGSVEVYVGRKYVGEVSLRSNRVRHRVMRYLPRMPRLLSGRVILRSTSTRPVRIDGLLLRRT